MDTPIGRRALELIPKLATTGIGSLPHTQQELALQCSLQLDIPFLPQLPIGRPGEFMISSALDGLPGLTFDNEGTCTIDVAYWTEHQSAFSATLDEAFIQGTWAPFEPSVTAHCSWRPFLWEVENRKLPFVKIQLAGPCTVRWVAKTTDGLPVSDVLQLEKQIFRLLWAKSLAMVKALRRIGATPVFTFDEPGLYALHPADARHLLALQELKMLCIALQKEGALVGVHCCSNTQWASLLNLGLDFLSMDVRLSLDAVLENTDAFRRFIQCGSTLMLGIVPTDLSAEFRLEELLESVEASLRAVWSNDAEFRQGLSRMLLSPACGLAMRTVKDSESIFSQLKEAQARLLSLQVS